MKTERRGRALNEERILAGLRGDSFVRRLIVVEELDSTNDEVRRLARDGAPEGVVVVAERQSRGRGRRERSWHSAPGLGLYLSVLLRPPAPVGETTRWTIAAAVAAAEACREVARGTVSIKWPNDLIAGRRKLGGILAELRSGGGPVSELVLGFGINVHHEEADFPAGLEKIATSLHRLGPTGMLERESLAADLLRRLGTLSQQLRRGDWDGVAARWEALSAAGRGRRVRVRAGAGESEGVTRGLGEDGALLVERPDGELISVRTAETITPLE